MQLPAHRHVAASEVSMRWQEEHRQRLPEVPYVAKKGGGGRDRRTLTVLRRAGLGRSDRLPLRRSRPKSWIGSQLPASDVPSTTADQVGKTFRERNQGRLLQGLDKKTRPAAGPRRGFLMTLQRVRSGKTVSMYKSNELMESISKSAHTTMTTAEKTPCQLMNAGAATGVQGTRPFHGIRIRSSVIDDRRLCKMGQTMTSFRRHGFQRGVTRKGHKKGLKNEASSNYDINSAP